MEFRVDLITEDTETQLKSELESTIQVLSRRCPNIRSLSLRVDWKRGTDGPSSSLWDAIHGLKQLEFIALTPFMITQHAFNVLGTLPDLVRINLIPEESRFGFVKAGDSGPFSTPTEAFPRLRSLLITCDIFHTKSLPFTGALTKLLSLHLDLHFYAGRENLHIFFQTLSWSCPDLRQLYVSCLVWPDEGTRINASTLSPLKSLTSLERLYVDLPHAAEITDEEFVEFIVGCSRLCSVCLNVMYDGEVKPELTLGCLRLLAEREQGRRVECLGIHVDATREIESLPDPLPLENLSYITFGTSPVKPGEDLVYYLMEALPSKCQTITLPALPRPSTQFPGENRADTEDQIEAKLDEWENVYSHIYHYRCSDGDQLAQFPIWEFLGPFFDEALGE